MHWKTRAMQCFSARYAKWRCICLRWRLRQAAGCPEAARKTARLAEDLYRLLRFAIAEKNENVAYRAVELLKQALGEGIGLQGSSDRVLQLCGDALSRRQFGVAGYLLGAYRPFIRCLEQKEIGAVLGGLFCVIYLAKRVHQEYLVERAAQCVLEGAARAGSESRLPALGALRLVGLQAVKGGDTALFRQSAKAVVALAAPEADLECERLFSIWLHQILKRDDERALQILRRVCAKLRKGDFCRAAFVRAVCAEGENAAGLIGANCRMRCRPVFIDLLLEVSLASAIDLRRAAYEIGRMARLAAALHGTEAGFTLLLPLLEQGRVCLKDELKFCHSVDTLRPDLLFVIVRECILWLEVASNQAGDAEPALLLSLRGWWRQRYQRESNRRSVDQFCQLLLRQMLVRRQSRRRRLDKSAQSFLTDAFFDAPQLQKLSRLM